MSLTSLPIEIITHIFNLFDESKPKKPHRVAKHNEMYKTLMALRLTCREFEEIASRLIFRTFSLWPSLESWKKFLSIGASEKVRVHVQIIAFEEHPDLNDFNCESDWLDNNLKIRRGMITAMTSPDLSFLDLSLLSNLRVLKAKDSWLITKKPQSNIKIPWGKCRIHAGLYCTAIKQPVFWDVLTYLEKITRYDFEISSLNCDLGQSGPWRSLLNLDFSGLKYLRLYFQDSYLSSPHDLPMALEILERLQNLPNLENFLLDESCVSNSSAGKVISLWSGRSIDFVSFRPGNYPIPLLRVHSTTQVLQKLRDKQWPRLRHLDLRSLYATVADFQAFAKPHAGSLKSFQLYNQVRCADETVEEEMRRHELPHWIHTVLCPQGGGTKVKLVNQATW